MIPDIGAFETLNTCSFHDFALADQRALTTLPHSIIVLELNPRGQVAPQVYVDNCDATNEAEGGGEGGAAVAT